MKKYICLLLAAASLLFSVGCINVPQNDALVVCGTHAVPGFYLRDLKGDTYHCDILETDAQGRILYEFTTLNVLSNQQEKAIVICQAWDQHHVFFYEDQCYLMPGYEDPDIIELKKRNDWDNPLDFSKMSQREIRISIDSVILSGGSLSAREICNMCSSPAIGIGAVSVQDLFFLDADGYGNELYFFTAKESGDKYFAVVNSNYDVSLFAVEENILDLPSYLTFKQASGWRYPTG